MAVLFKSEGHVYESVDPTDNISWVSVTRLVGQFEGEFDAVAVSERCSKSTKSPWYKMAPDKIREVWQNENRRATELGTFYHKLKEDELRGSSTVHCAGKDLPVFFPKEEAVKYAPLQRLIEGVYPEHFVYLKSAGVCGQSDRVEVVNGKVNIKDYKTNKEITTEAARTWDGFSYKLLPPLNYLEKCHLVGYSLQLSIYMYIILRHNPQLEAGEMTLEHVTFKEEGKDENGYPKTLYEDGKPVIDKITIYPVKYLKNEVLKMFTWLETNRDKVQRK